MRTSSRRFVAALLILAPYVSIASSVASGGENESLGIRGHWVIEVRDLEGRPVTRREFDNALEVANPIARLLTGQNTAGPLTISLECVAVGCTRPCHPLGNCTIGEPRQALPAGDSYFKNLTLTSGANGLQLRGFAVVSSDTTIDRVATDLYSCARTVAPRSCVTGTFSFNLTSAVLSPGIAVSAGQQVLATVTITAATAAAPQNGAQLR
jgi:hypothetical protein